MGQVARHARDGQRKKPQPQWVGRGASARGIQAIYPCIGMIGSRAHAFIAGRRDQLAKACPLAVALWQNAHLTYDIVRRNKRVYKQHRFSQPGQTTG